MKRMLPDSTTASLDATGLGTVAEDSDDSEADDTAHPVNEAQPRAIHNKKLFMIQSD